MMNNNIGFSSLEQMLISQADQLKTPISGTLELLPLCNMNCDMCYVKLSNSEIKKKGKLIGADRWITLAEQMKDAGVLFLLLTGGEPLIYPEFQKLYIELQRMGMILTINTNGTLLNTEWANFFHSHKPRRINVTLYGGSEATYTDLCHYPDGYQKTIQALHLLKEYEIDTKINYTVTQKNVQDLEQIIKIAKKLDFPITIDTYMIPINREREQPFNMQSRLHPEDAAYARIKSWKVEMDPRKFALHQKDLLTSVDNVSNQTLKYTNNIYCHAGNSSFTITWDGNMCPCLTLPQISIDVFKSNFKTAWEYIVKETQAIRINTKCADCTYRPTCRTCAACAMAETGSYTGLPEYMCAYAKESYRLLL